MKIIVDTNVIFSAILSSSGKIGQILIYGRKQFEFYAPNLVKVEIKRHRHKMIQFGELTDSDFEENRDDIFSCITFISEEQIPYEYWREAIPLVRDTDMDDIAFVVLAEYLDAQLWTGDNKLLKGLINVGFTKGVTTDEVYAMLQSNDHE
ncbi:MAG: PIN domain-containing protein [Saprospiraceae bacterium]